jgi:hypothetical protein
VPSVITVVIVAFIAISGLGVLIGNQFAYLADSLPQYKYNIIEKIHSLQGAATNGSLVQRITTMFRDLDKEISKPTDKATKDGSQAPRVPPRAAQPQAAAPPEIHQPNLAPMQVAQGVLGPLRSGRALA